MSVVGSVGFDFAAAPVDTQDRVRRSVSRKRLSWLVAGAVVVVVVVEHGRCGRRKGRKAPLGSR